jgi:uncharacterized surface anchored protein
MRNFFFSLLILVSSVPAFSQTSSIKGSVIDSVDKKNLVFTTITLLRKADSTLAKFTRAGKDGKFLLSNLKPGNYILMNTHPYLGDYFDNISLKENEQLDLGYIYDPKNKTA